MLEEQVVVNAKFFPVVIVQHVQIESENSMGWSSFVEDIRDRLTDDLRDLQKRLDAGDWIPNANSEARRILQRAEEAVVRLFRELDFATDPRLDLAHELFEEKATRIKIQANLVRAQEDITQL